MDMVLGRPKMIRVVWVHLCAIFLYEYRADGRRK